MPTAYASLFPDLDKSKSLDPDIRWFHYTEELARTASVFTAQAVTCVYHLLAKLLAEGQVDVDQLAPFRCIRKA